MRKVIDLFNENKNERLFSEIIAFRIRLKGTRFYGKIALLTSDQDSVKKNFRLLRGEIKWGRILVNVFAGT